jgi:hypothetical protein
MGGGLLRWAFPAVVALLLAACGSSGAVSTVAPPTPIPAPPITVSGATKTGVSKSLTLAGGSYSVAWTVTAPKGGCYFYLYLTPKANGPTVEDVKGPLNPHPLAGSLDGTEEWTGVPAGTYVLQEDRTGLLNCTGAWSATITPQ